MKLVGGDNGRIEREEFVEEVLISPSERAIVDVLFEQAGQLALEHRTPDKAYTLGTVDVSEQPEEHSFAREFTTLRGNEALAAERVSIAADFDRAPDKTLALVGEMGHGGHGGHPAGDIEWEDTMELMNRMSTPKNMHWKLVDRETGAENHAIQWSFQVADRVKIRLVNEPHGDHPMQHPMHMHGQHFLVLKRNGIPNTNLQWKDTVLCRAGETVDLLVEMTNPGAWMAHCHIAEHIESHMMLTFLVRQPHEASQPAARLPMPEHRHHGHAHHMQVEEGKHSGHS
jgi:FtsP/CotA-like multicopper oxidase with cupredoxin domain